MNKLKELWQYAVFRWLCLVPLVGVGIYLIIGFLYGVIGIRGGIHLVVIVIISPFVFSTIWVWRKPLWRVIGFLNKKAD